MVVGDLMAGGTGTGTFGEPVKWDELHKPSTTVKPFGSDLPTFHTLISATGTLAALMMALEVCNNWGNSVRSEALLAMVLKVASDWQEDFLKRSSDAGGHGWIQGGGWLACACIPMRAGAAAHL